MTDPDKSTPLSDGELEVVRMASRGSLDEDVKDDPMYSYWPHRMLATIDHLRAELAKAHSEIESLRESALRLATDLKKLREQR